MDPVPDKYRHDFAIIRETAEQITRDLSIDESELQLSGSDNAFEELKNQLRSVLKRLFKENPSSFQSMLYRVDINEKDYKNTLNNSQGFEEALSELIIRREFRKVLTRKYFSGKL